MSRDEIITYASSAIPRILNIEPSPSDIETFCKWIIEMGFSIELVEHAMMMADHDLDYKRMTSTGELLQVFRKYGIETVAEAEDLEKYGIKEQRRQKSGYLANTNGSQRTVQVPVREDKRIMTPPVRMHPCPFCGYNGIYLVIQNSTKFSSKYVLVECGQCEASTKSIGIHHDMSDDMLSEVIPEVQKVIDLWNTRA